MHLTFVDTIFTVIILLFAFIACAHGLIKEIFGKIAVVAAILAALMFCGTLSPYLTGIVNNQAVCTILAFLMIFIAVFILVKVIQVIISGIFSGEILKSLDHVLGFIVGAIEGLIIVSLVFVIVKGQPWFDLSSLTENSFYWEILSPFLEKPVTAFRGILA